MSTTNYAEHGEVFGIVPVVPPTQYENFTADDISHYPSALKFLALRMKTKVPHLPVQTFEERRLFARTVLQYMPESGKHANIDFCSMADDWNNIRLKFIGVVEKYQMDGVKIRQKLPEHLRTHFKVYFRNAHRQSLIQLNRSSLHDLRQAMFQYSQEFASEQQSVAEPIQRPQYSFGDEEEDDDQLTEAILELMDINSCSPIDNMQTSNSSSPSSNPSSTHERLLSECTPTEEESRILFVASVDESDLPPSNTALVRRQTVEIHGSNNLSASFIDPNVPQVKRRRTVTNSNRRCPCHD